MSKRSKSMQNESKVADLVSARVNIASGSLWFLKGDLRLPNFLLEDKMTDKEYYILKLKTWEKINKEAIRDSLRQPIMTLNIDGDRFGVMFYSTLQQLVLEKDIEPIVNKKVEETKYKSYRVRDFDVPLSNLNESEIKALEKGRPYIEVLEIDFTEKNYSLAVMQIEQLAYLLEEE